MYSMSFTLCVFEGKGSYNIQWNFLGPAAASGIERGVNHHFRNHLYSDHQRKWFSFPDHKNRDGPQTLVHLAFNHPEKVLLNSITVEALDYSFTMPVHCYSSITICKKMSMYLVPHHMLCSHLCLARLIPTAIILKGLHVHLWKSSTYTDENTFTIWKFNLIHTTYHCTYKLAFFNCRYTLCQPCQTFGM